MEWPAKWARSGRQAARPATERHNILPPSDPLSTVNPANLVKTCGQCHTGATANFAKGQIHLDPTAIAKADFGAKVNNLGPQAFTSR